MKPASLIAATCVVAVPVLLLALQGARSRRHPPASLAPTGAGLAACPSSPNCVRSSGTGGRRALAPLHDHGPAEAARRRLHEVLRTFPRTRIVTDAWPYVHVEFRSRWFGFVDDVEFLAAGADGRIDFRSASRVGFYDLGVNRRRMEELRRRLEGAQRAAEVRADP